MRAKNDYFKDFDDEKEESDIYSIDSLEELEIEDHEKGFMAGYLRS